MSALHLLSTLALMAFLLALPARAATTLQELADDKRVQVTAWLTPAQGIVPGQKVDLSLEVATDRWFAGGTRIEIPEVPGLVILQTENFAANASEQRQGTSWVLQRWSLEIYPQRGGNFALPPISLQVKVAGDGGSTISGELQAPALNFSVRIPPELEQAEHWVAAPQFRVEQSFDRPTEGLAVGDAITRTITFEANDVMAMMLPALASNNIPGLRSYPEPPVLENQNNRGAQLARRVETRTYLVEQPGNYTLPALEFFWWDTRSAEVELLSLPTVTIVAGGTAAEPHSAQSPAAPRLRSVIAALAVAVVALVVALAGKRYLPALGQLCLRAWHWLANSYRQLRRPALASRLNPGSNAED